MSPRPVLGGAAPVAPDAPARTSFGPAWSTATDRPRYQLIPPGGAATDTAGWLERRRVGVVYVAPAPHCWIRRDRIWRVTGSVLSSPATYFDIELPRW